MPGAVCFDPDDSVDGLWRTTRASALAAPAPAAAGGVAAAPPAPPLLVGVHTPPYFGAHAARPAARARAALPLVSDRSGDDA